MTTDRVVAVNERVVDGQRYRVTIIETGHIPPWGTEPCRFQIAKWEKLKPAQTSLFD